MRRLVRPAAVAVILAAGITGFASRADAEAPAEQGWWTQSNPGITSRTGEPVPAPPAPADVPANGLLIEGGSSTAAPIAYAGLVYQLPIAASVGILTLTVAPNSGSTPSTTLRVCPLVNPVLNAEQGGPMADAPAYDCTHSTSAQTSSNGDSYQFHVSTLAANSTLAIAILPTTPSDRVVFSQPGDNSLIVGGAVSPATSTSTPANHTAVTDSTAAPPVNSSPNVVRGAFPVSGTSFPAIIDKQPTDTPVIAPSTPAAPSLAAPTTMPTIQPSSNESSAPSLVATSGTTRSKVNFAVLIFVLVGLAVALTMWVAAGQDTQPRSSRPTTMSS